MKKQVLSLLVLFVLTTTIFGQNEYWAGFTQQVDIAAYKGLPFKAQVAMKMESDMEVAKSYLWTRVHKKDKSVASMDMQELSQQEATKEWKLITIEGEIDADASFMMIGGRCDYNGSFFFDDFSLQIQQEGKWINIPLDNGGFEDTTFEHVTYGGKTSDRKMIKSWIGYIMDANRATFTPKAISQNVYKGNSALLVEGKGYFYAPAYLKKFAGEWDLEYVPELSEDFMDFQDKGSFKWTASSSGYTLNEIQIDKNDPQHPKVISEGSLAYFPASEKIVWNIDLIDGGPRLFTGKMDASGNIHMEADDATFSNQSLKESFSYQWINEDELAVIWKFYMPNVDKKVKRYWKVTRKNNESTNNEKATLLKKYVGKWKSEFIPALSENAPKDFKLQGSYEMLSTANGFGLEGVLSGTQFRNGKERIISKQRTIILYPSIDKVYATDLIPDAAPFQMVGDLNENGDLHLKDTHPNSKAKRSFIWINENELANVNENGNRKLYFKMTRIKANPDN